MDKKAQNISYPGEGRNPNGPSFPERLEKSHEAVNATLFLLSDRGHRITLPPTHLRPSRSQWKEYTDNGDLEISFRIEVKHRTDLSFSSAETFPYETVIVNEVRKVEKYKVAPIWYFIWNSDLSFYAFIDAKKTRKHWTKTTRYDHKSEKECVFYECPKKYVRFIKR